MIKHQNNYVYNVSERKRFAIQHGLASNTKLTIATCDQQTKATVNHTEKQRQARRERDRAHRQSLTLEEREEVNARRRARSQARRDNLTPQEREEINARRRARRKNMTQEERERINARQREGRWNLPIERKEEVNARRRARRQCLLPEQRQTLLNQRNASYAARRDAPCKESIALQCPTSSVVGCSYASSCTSTLAQTHATTQGNSGIHIPLISLKEEILTQ